ncbi:MAG TPA: hypothetical protein VKP64_07075 [Mycobacteriales bacterium]|nr:hypothetical protein [Mycobacteriales bacterium]
MSGYRYGEWRGGPDPLAAPYDVAGALDALGEDVLDGATPREALDRLLRRGLPERRGLDDLLRQVRRRQRELRDRHRLDGALERVRELLDRAVSAERGTLFPDPSGDARLREAELDALPRDTSRAVRQLADYAWRAPEARAAYDEIRDLLRRDVLDQQFQGLSDALRSTTAEDLRRVKDMLGALHEMLDADARGEDTRERFERFMADYGEFFPERPENLEDLVDQLARRAAAAQRLLDSLTPDQRAELSGLVQQALEDMGLAAEMARLSSSLRARRPDLDWSGGQRLRGPEPLGLGDATTVLSELADLDELAATLGQDYPGASLDDVDEDAVARALGRQAVDDLAALRAVERELERQGYLVREEGRLELSPKAVRRLGHAALKRIFGALEARRAGDHDQPDAGTAGEPTGASRAWRFGDEQPLDVVRTVSNAVRRAGPTGGAVRLSVQDFEVVETERRTRAAVALLVDLSYSMALRGTWGAAKATALALHSLIATRYPQDALAVIGFSKYARRLAPGELAGLSWDMVQGTNLQHALLFAGRHLARHPDAEPVVLVVTDGEPTAHLLPDGSSYFDWPPARETVEVTLAEVDRLTRRGATINVFLLADDERLARFVDEVARRNGGRVFAPTAEQLGEYVVTDYLRARQGRRRAAAAGGTRPQTPGSRGR